jgi:hypothetical protein
VTAFSLLAFFLQGLAVQSHVHGPLQSQAERVAQTQAPGPLKTQNPVDQCSLCQELMHAGAFVAPSAASTDLNPSFVTAIYIASPGFASASTTDFAWRSRAPPHA